MNAETTPRLGTLPVAFPATVAALHRVAEQVVAPARKPDNEIALDGDARRLRHAGVRVRRRRATRCACDGAELVHRAGDERAPRAADDARGRRGGSSPSCVPAGPLGDTPLDLDPTPPPRLADWYAFGDDVLEELVADAAAEDDADPVRLWPEHFDIAIELGDEAAGARANYGFSPGDEDHPEPYAYVGPWTARGRRRAVERDRLPRRRADLRRAAGGARPARRRARVLHDPQGGARHEHGGIACWPPTSCPRAASRPSRPATRASRSSTTTGSSPRSTTTARTRAARSARARSRTGCCAARGTASTTARSTASRPASTTRRRPTRSRSATARCSSASRTSAHVATVTDLMAETMVNWGVEHVFGMVGHSNLGLADALRRQEEAGQAHLHRHPPRGRRGVRRLRLRQAHRPARRVPDDRRPGRHQPAHRPVGREGRPRAGARAHRPGRHAGARPGRVPGGRPVAARSARSPRGASRCCATPTRSS